MGMTTIDYVVLVLYSAIVVLIGVWALRKTKTTAEYFAGGWKVPWWLAAISHHMSGYSAFAFVAYAGVAWKYGFSIYTVWSVTIGIGLIVTAFTFAPRWAKLAKKAIMTPLEYLEQRYNVIARIVLALSGIGVKFVDEGLKIYSLAVFLSVFMGIPLVWSVIIGGVIVLIYMTIGGILASLWTDFLQAIVQFSITIITLFIALQVVGGIGGLVTKAPEGFWQPLSGPYNPLWWFIFLIVVTLSYAGGTWGLAQRFISVGKPKEARRAALLSSILYFTYPLSFFIPMWATRIIYPSLDKPDYAYAIFCKDYLPKVAPGLLGLMAAAMFAATMSMVDSDLNALAAVLTKDVYGRIRRGLSDKHLLNVGRIATFIFGLITIGVALVAPQLGGAFQAMVKWYAGLLGPISIPLLFGLLYRGTSWRGALASWAGGFTVWAILNFGLHTPWEITTGCQLLTSFVIFFLEPLIVKKSVDEERRVTDLFEVLRDP